MSFGKSGWLGKFGPRASDTPREEVSQVQGEQTEGDQEHGDVTVREDGLGNLLQRRVAHYARQVRKVGRHVAMASGISETLNRRSAEQGDASAQYELGYMYANGLGVSQDEEAAASWYCRAAEQGHVLAQYELGCIYANGCGIPQDEEVAVSWYRLAANQGHGAAQRELGAVYASGRGVARDDETAVSWYRPGGGTGRRHRAVQSWSDVRERMWRAAGRGNGRVLVSSGRRPGKCHCADQVGRRL